jgi:hypothetical protein
MKYIKILFILIGFLFLGANIGQALISPEHYERIMKERQKAKDNEKKNSQTPDKVHHPDLKKAQPSGPARQGVGH